MEPERRAADSSKTTFNILFVCTGNTCRSPLAEALARSEVGRRGWSHVQVASAGVAARDGEAASEHAVVVASHSGLSLDDHHSRTLTGDMVDWADLVLVMSPSHLVVVDRFGGSDKVALIGDFAVGEEGEGESVPDPFGGDAAAYEATFSELGKLVNASLDRLAPILAP